MNHQEPTALSTRCRQVFLASSLAATRDADWRLTFPIRVTDTSDARFLLVLGS